MKKQSNPNLVKTIIEATKSKNEKTACDRCCTCCAHGGPALHTEDLELIKNGKLHGRFLYTIREGEPAEDNVQGGMIYTDSDIIKIKSKENADACLYADFPNNQCAIYDNRPLECRTLKCWDTKDLEEMYNKNYLTREEIIGKVEGLWELVSEHQEKCSFAKVREIIDNSHGTIEGKAMEELLEIVQYDISIRALVLEKTDTDPNLMHFLFGTPLQTILKKMGIEFKLKNSSS